jgi:hypothetical protein
MLISGGWSQQQGESMARRSPQTQAKRERELAKAKKRQDKAVRREQRKELRDRNAGKSAEDPDAERDDANADDSGPA